MIACRESGKQFTRRCNTERNKNAMHSSGEDDERVDTEVYTKVSLGDTDQVRKSRNYVYEIWQC